MFNINELKQIRDLATEILDCRMQLANPALNRSSQLNILDEIDFKTDELKKIFDK